LPLRRDGAAECACRLGAAMHRCVRPSAVIANLTGEPGSTALADWQV
jgi:hypothetical protein